MTEHGRVNILGYEIYADALNQISIKDGVRVINTLNANSYAIAKTDPSFSKALKTSDILLPDGFPIVLAAKLLHKKRIKKIAGYDLFSHLMSELNKAGGSCFFLGASKYTLYHIKKKVKKEYLNIRTHTYSPPFTDDFTPAQNAEMIRRINIFSPDILFVGMTAPKQEKWVAENQNALHCKMICAIGAVFDFYSGIIPRPGEIWIRFNLEWFVRLVKEPKRLWRRYLVKSPVFFVDLIKEKFRKNSGTYSYQELR